MKSKFLSCLMWNMELFCMQFSRIGLIMLRGGRLIVFVVLRREPGVYSRVTMGKDL